GSVRKSKAMKTKLALRGTRRHKSRRDNFKVRFGVHADTNTARRVRYPALLAACRDSVRRWSPERSLVTPSRSAALRRDVSIRFGSSFGRREKAALLNVAVT